MAESLLAVLAAAASLGAPTVPPALLPPLVHYDCWHFTTPVGILNFTLLPGGKYLDSENGRGTFSYYPATEVLVFHGAGHDGDRMTYKLEGGKTPTLTFGNGDLCQPGD